MEAQKSTIPQWSSRGRFGLNSQVVSTKNIWIRSLQLTQEVLNENKEREERKKRAPLGPQCSLCMKIIRREAPSKDLQLPAININSQGIFHGSDISTKGKTKRKSKLKFTKVVREAQRMGAPNAIKEREYCKCNVIRRKMKTCKNSFLREDRDSDVLRHCRLPVDEDEDIFKRYLRRFSVSAEDKCLTYTYLSEKCKDKHLSLANHGLSENWGYVMTEILSHSTSIRSLDLRGNNLREDGVKLLTKALESNKTIESIDLSGNNLGNSFALASLARVLDFNNTIQHLSLAGNLLTDLDVEPLISACIYNTTLIRLNLRANRLKALSAEYLKQLLLDNTTLEDLDISCNEIGPNGVRILFEGMEANTALKRLNISTNGIGEDGIQALGSVTALGSDLSFLDLSDNMLTDRAVTLFARFFQNSNNLRALRLDDNPFSSTSLRILLKSILNANEMLLMHLSVGKVFLDEHIRQLLKDMRSRNEKFAVHGGLGIARDSSNAFRTLDSYMARNSFLLATPAYVVQPDDEDGSLPESRSCSQMENDYEDEKDFEDEEDET